MQYPFPLIVGLLFVGLLCAEACGAESASQPAGTLVRFAAPWSSPLHVDRAWPYALVNDEGQHLFILNKTAWAFFGCKDPAGYLDRAKAEGVDVIRVALEGRPYFEQLGIDLWPWGGTRERPDFGSFDDAYWRRVEERVRLAGEKGMGLDVVLYFTLHPGQSEIAVQNRYWQEALRRLGRYANVAVWEIENEYVGDEAFQDAAGMFFREKDPFGRPVGTSDGTTDDAVWPDKPWMSLAINHTCTGSGGRYPLDRWYLAVARNTRSHGKPAFCNESGREKRHGNDDGVHRRKQGWLWCTAGGYWTWHSWDGCEGIDDASYRAPGAEFVWPMAEFYRSIPFWRLAPNYTAVRVEGEALIHTTLADADRSLIVAYACTEKTGRRVEGATAVLRLPSGQYRVALIRPSDLTVLEARDCTANRWEEHRLALPAFVDDLLIQVERVQAGERGAIPGTH